MRTLGLLALLLLFPPLAQAQSGSDDTEVRGVWLTNVASDVLSSKENIASAMDYLAANGFNVVFPVVWNKGYTLYPSQVMVDYFGEAYRQDLSYTGQRRDPLAEVIAEARRVGLEVIPWFEFGFAASFSQDGGHIIDRYPEWAAIGTDGNLVVKNGFDWMNGLHPGPQGLLLDLIDEVVQNYDVDGVQGDDRLPAMPSEGGYDAYTTALYQAETGRTPPTNTRDNDWLVWRASKLTQFLGRMYRQVKAADPDLYVSLSPSHYPFGFVEYLQNTPQWIDSSYVDLLHPQLYNPVGNQISRYQDLVRATVGPTPTSGGGYVPPSFRDRLAPGVLGGVGSQPNRNDPAFLVSAVEYNREFGLGGEVFFFYESLRERNDFAADSLHKYVYEQPARLPGRDLDRARQPGTVVTPDSAGVTLSGTWTQDGRAFGFEGRTMEFAAPGTDSQARYSLTAPQSGGFDVYAYVPRFRSGSTTDAYYAVGVGSDTTVVRMDQRSSYNQGFVYLATVGASEGETVSVTIRPDQVTDGRATYADAVLMVRNFSAERRGLVTSERPRAEPATLSVRALPNPARTWATFELGAAGDATSVRLYDALGRQVALKTAPASVTRLDLPVADLAPGVYLWEARSGAKRATGTLVVAPR
jgi:uncharacterized lipoprotein YddW (UPF0748 family)